MCVYDIWYKIMLYKIILLSEINRRQTNRNIKSKGIIFSIYVIMLIARTTSDTRTISGVRIDSPNVRTIELHSSNVRRSRCTWNNCNVDQPRSRDRGVAQHRPSAKLKLKTKRIATLPTVDSNRRERPLPSSLPRCIFQPSPAAHHYPLSAVYLHNGPYLATIRARACSIIDYASFHGQRRGLRARKTARRRENARHSASESPRRLRTMDGYSSFHFLVREGEQPRRFDCENTNVCVGFAAGRRTFRGERSQWYYRVSPISAIPTLRINNHVTRSTFGTWERRLRFSLRQNCKTTVAIYSEKVSLQRTML